MDAFTQRLADLVEEMILINWVHVVIDDVNEAFAWKVQEVVLKECISKSLPVSNIIVLLK